MEIKNYFAQDAQGNIMPSANCYLYLPGTTTLATGLVDGNGVPISNPFLASSIGQVTFGAPNGVYDLRISQGARDTTIEIQCADLLQAINETASFLGAKSSAPTTRNDGAPLQLSDRYLNTTDQVEYIYKSEGWTANNLDGQLLASSQGASLLGAVMQDGSIGTIQQAINSGDNSLRKNLASLIDPNMGTGMLGYVVGSQGSVGRTLHNKMAAEHVSIADFGAISGGARGVNSSVNALAIMRAILYVHNKGGGSVLVPATADGYRTNYPPFVMDRVELYGEGPGSKIIFEDPVFSHGRGGIVIGSSLEANRNKALAAYNAGTFPAAPILDPAYVNLPLGTFLRDNPSKVETRDACVHDLYLVAEWASPTGWGGYGINFVNSWNCHAWNIWGEGWTQLIGMGSDVAPETPSNHMCTVRNYHVIKPDPYRTYYAMGFQANSTNCFMYDQFQHAPCTETWESVGKEGNGIAANTCENGGIFGVYVPNLGRVSGGSSAGVYIADCKDFDVDDVYVGNARRAAQSFFFVSSGDPLRPVRFGANITGKNCDIVIDLGSKYVNVAGFQNVGSLTDINFFNSNVTGCTVSKKPEKMTFGAGLLNYQYLDNNKIKGWEPKDIYLRPVSILLNDKVDTSGWDANKRVGAKAGVKLTFLWEVPPSVSAVRGFSFYTTYAGDAQAAGMSITASIRRMVGFNGNTAEAALIKQTVTAAAVNTTTADRLITSSTADLVINDSSTEGLPNSLDFIIEVNSPTLNSSVKESRIRVYM